MAFAGVAAAGCHPGAAPRAPWTRFGPQPTAVVVRSQGAVLAVYRALVPVGGSLHLVAPRGPARWTIDLSVRGEDPRTGGRTVAVWVRAGPARSVVAAPVVRLERGERTRVRIEGAKRPALLVEIAWPAAAATASWPCPRSGG